MKTRSFDLFSPGEADMPAYPDEQLVLEALDDSHAAFGQLIKQYQYRVLRTIASIIGNEYAAQDVAQETFLAAWSDLAKLKEREKFGIWLNRIAINLSKDWLRDQRKHRENKVPLDENTVVMVWESSYQLDRLRQAIWDAIDELTEDYKESVILYYISGYSYKEISEMLSVPVSTVQGRLQQARNQLRKEFLDMVTQLQLEIDSTVHKFLKEHAKQDGVSVEGLIIRLIERYKRDANTPGIITRQIWENSLSSGMGTVSPDRRYLSYANWDNGNLAMRNFETGENRDVTDEGNKESAFAGASVWSPDSKQIAYLWFKNTGDKREASLRIVGINGAKPRVLCSNPPKTALEPRAWSQDGKHILAIHFRKDETKDIALVSVADGSIRTLKSLGLIPTLGLIPMNLDNTPWMSLSPDSRYAVYSLRPSFDSPKHDIFLLATDGSQEMILVEHPANNFAPIWSPDGNQVVFISDRSGSMGVWVLEVVDGKPKGSPQPIKQNLLDWIYPLGLTQDGSYYYGLASGSMDVYVATLDPETCEVVIPPAKAVQSFEGFNASPIFSPDGKYLTYTSWRPRGGSGYSKIMVIRSLETGEERELLPKLTSFGRFACWSPDGRSILTYSNGPEAAKQKLPGFYQIDTETGAATPLVLDDEQGRIPAIMPPVWSPDGSRIFFMRRHDGVNVIRAYDFEAKREWKPDFQLACGEGYAYGLALSPDCQQLAFVVSCDDEWSLQIAPSSGGDTREIFRLPKAEKPQFPDGAWFVWTPDGDHLLFARRKDEATELWKIPVEGGEPQNLGLAMNVHGGLSIHPDGRRIAFTSSAGYGAEVWAMENFLPGFTADR